ncbi:hypothetical protein [Terriglobus aquaticus]|uniref:F0F1-ATPase subunit Ca2+/Mg2+ transporter n=1 Tax=Terriglobus aquaticus TaxID=940139 RepID=A0ABW9KH63_9BACT|nr:hypothetical protein [Terriglobus aquaticus]
MANLRLPVQERNLTPAEVEALDARRRRGQLGLVIGFQAAIITTLLTLWVGQDLTYSPGLQRPMFYWACITGLLSLGGFAYGLANRRGSTEFISY